MYPIGMHLTGPLRETVKKVTGHERVLLAALFHCTSRAADHPEANLLRPLPYLLYLADGDIASGGSASFNVFVGQRLQPVQKVFKRHPMADCAPPPELTESLGLAPGHPVHLGTVLARCPHYVASMRTKWGMHKQPGESKDCLLL